MPRRTSCASAPESYYAAPLVFPRHPCDRHKLIVSRITSVDPGRFATVTRLAIGVDVTVLGLVGGAPGGETPRVADSSAAGAVLAVCKTLGIEGRQFGNEPV